MLRYLCSLLALFIALPFATPLSSATDPHDTRPLVLILLGPSGSGQGVLAVKVSKRLGIPHISTADLIHDEINQDTEIGAKATEYLNTYGSIPDELLLEMLYSRIKSTDCRHGFLLDTFPRSVAQAESLQKTLGTSHRIVAVAINVNKDTLLERLGGRLVCQQCGRVYHTQLSPPKSPMICDHCGTALTQRCDDTPESVQRKLDEYATAFAPILAFYKKEGLLQEVNGNVSLDDLFTEITKIAQ